MTTRFCAVRPASARSGVLLVLVSFVTMAMFVNVPGLILGVILLDEGTQISPVGNQSFMFALDSAARNRINALFMTGMFLVGATAFGAAAWLWHARGWSAVVTLGGAAAATVLAIAFVSGKPGAATESREPAAAA